MVWHFDYRYRNDMPYHVTLLDAAGLEVDAWGVDGDGRRVDQPRPENREL